MKDFEKLNEKSVLKDRCFAQNICNAFYWLLHCGPKVESCYNKGDYCAIENNKVYDNTWWSSNAESAIVLADSRNIDNLDIAKMFLVRNEVYGNRNYIPYYNEKYDDPQYLIDNQMHVARPGYGSKNQTFIIDGSGISKNFPSYSV